MSNDQPRTDTSTYKMNHTMVRVKDPKRSVKFYEDNFGMSLINKLDNPDAKFCLYFLAFDSPEADSYGKVWTDREGLLELTHNYGTEDDPSYKVNNGNDDPEHQDKFNKCLRGYIRFGHIAISVNNITRTCEELAAAGVQFKKPLSKDRSLDACREDIVYALDPDGYYIALIQLSIAASEAPQRPKWRFSHTMLRVKDMEASTHFYASYLGMATLYRTKNQGKADFEQAFMGYQRPEDGQNSLDAILNREGVVELVQYRGTEKQDNVNYHNGNDQPQGFGHVCISVDDLDLACARFGIMEGVRWKKRLTDGRMKNVAFLLDPDGYWVEVLQNEALKKRANW